MTATLDTGFRAPTAPGRDMYADLTPPELLNARRLRGLQKTLALGLTVLVALVALLFLASMWRSHQATTALAQQQARTATLQADVQRYGQVTQIQGSTRLVRGQLAGLVAGDVDVAALLGSVRTALPASMALGEVGVTLTDPGAATAAAAGSANAGSLDTSGAAVIGAITVSGNSEELVDLAGYVRALQATRGIVDVVPTTNQRADSSFAYTVTMSVTERVLSHRFDIPETGTGR